MTIEQTKTFKVGQRVKYLPKCGKRFLGTILDVRPKWILVQWDNYEDGLGDLHLKDELGIIEEDL